LRRVVTALRAPMRLISRARFLAVLVELPMAGQSIVPHKTCTSPTAHLAATPPPAETAETVGTVFWVTATPSLATLLRHAVPTQEPEEAATGERSAVRTDSPEYSVVHFPATPR